MMFSPSASKFSYAIGSISIKTTSDGRTNAYSLATLED